MEILAVEKLCLSVFYQPARASDWHLGQ
jgi:hypothetical protein